jgi:hypothetical protein
MEGDDGPLTTAQLGDGGCQGRIPLHDGRQPQLVPEGLVPAQPEHALPSAAFRRRATMAANQARRLDATRSWSQWRMASTQADW